jgi:spore coat polysaccharide biosynthesis protein SpsF
MILAILQARMSSTRLPGKVLRAIMGRPMVELHIERIRRAKRIDRLVLATSEDSSDDPVVAVCERLGVDVYRGPLADVLGRYHGAAEAFGPADHIVRLTADCPLADHSVIDDCIALHLAEGADYTSNGVERTYPDGLDVEVMKKSALDRAFREATLSAEREHVTMHLYGNRDRFSVKQLIQTPDLGQLRWTVDTPADFAMVDAVYEALYPVKSDFLQRDILDLLERRPDIAAINQPNAQGLAP